MSNQCVINVVSAIYTLLTQEEKTLDFANVLLKLSKNTISKVKNPMKILKGEFGTLHSETTKQVFSGHDISEAHKKADTTTNSKFDSLKEKSLKKICIKSTTDNNKENISVKL
ncbi:hypothetical protein HZS_133 [Henneguya salminicola]|nr:hypothetical protein HZS_133 [Henneguya salminicola]